MGENGASLRVNGAFWGEDGAFEGKRDNSGAGETGHIRGKWGISGKKRGISGVEMSHVGGNGAYLWVKRVFLGEYGELLGWK